MSAPDALFAETSYGEGYRRSDKGGTDVWLTPPAILSALGPFDLDPCAAPEPRPWPTAKRHLTYIDNGLRNDWAGRVWLNPPYSDARPWLARLADHGDGIALIFARTDTAAFHEQCWERADAMLFLRGRLTFHRHDGKPGRANAGAPSVLVAYGVRNVASLSNVVDSGSLTGAFVDLRPARETVR